MKSISGKYIVRLFWMGYWRMIIVDDTIPLSLRNRLLLPSVASENSSDSSKNIIEIWPFILSKAILKITSIMRCEEKSIYDDVILSCLTGWHVLDKIDGSGIII